MSRPPRTVREDVHIHAAGSDVRALIVGSRRWHPRSIEASEASAEAFTFRLLLPLRTEQAELARASDEEPLVLEFAAAGNGHAVRGMTWVINTEAAREVHLVAELVYEPAGGPVGWALEELLHRPSRRQALRDALWRLKLLAEGRE